jgi:hypothetical protein
MCKFSVHLYSSSRLNCERRTNPLGTRLPPLRASLVAEGTVALSETAADLGICDVALHMDGLPGHLLSAVSGVHQACRCSMPSMCPYSPSASGKQDSRYDLKQVFDSLFQWGLGMTRT